MSLEDMDTGELSEFRELQQRVEGGKWITTPPTWVEFLEQNTDGRKKSESDAGSG